MKVVVSCLNNFKVAGDVQRFLVDGEKITFEFRTRATLTFLKEFFDENRFALIQNMLKTVNVSSNAIGIIDFVRGTVRLDSTSDSKELYDSVVNAGVQGVTPSTTQSAPLINGRFTQKPQGAVNRVSPEVLSNIGMNTSASSLTDSQRKPTQ